MFYDCSWKVRNLRTLPVKKISQKPSKFPRWPFLKMEIISIIFDHSFSVTMNWMFMYQRKSRILREFKPFKKNDDIFLDKGYLSTLVNRTNDLLIVGSHDITLTVPLKRLSTNIVCLRIISWGLECKKSTGLPSCQWFFSSTDRSVSIMLTLPFRV